jgi:two-component system response regulator (stage 0 sporulation protein A)
METTFETKAGQTLSRFAKFDTREIERNVSEIFMLIGIPPHIKGHKFLREAIKLAVVTPNIITGITKELYPCVANCFATTPSKVERAIRHAIEVCWNRNKIDKINDVFGCAAFSQHDRPTNGEFIALLADRLLLNGVGQAV